MKTKFGSARFDGRYMKISSRKEGNENKLLHRLIFEDFYQTKLPKDIVIHHDDGNPLNNEIWNLIPMTAAEHNTLHHKGTHHTEESKEKIRKSTLGEKNHFYGKHHTEETKKLISEKNSGENNPNYGKPMKDKQKRLISLKKNTTGYRNVSIQKCPTCKRGFRWRYNYSENGKVKAIQSVSLESLKEKVLANGLVWEEFNEATI